MSSRTEKVQFEIDKAKEKLLEQQAKLRELENKKTEIENTEIVEAIRGLSIPLDELAPLLKSIRNAAPSTAAIPTTIIPDTKEDA